jgi:hypothetical protein
MKGESSKNITIGFSAMVDMGVDDKAVFITHELGLLLSNNLNISDYGEKLKETCMIFMAMDPATHSFRQDKKLWSWKHGVFGMYVNVPDYEEYCKITTKAEAKKVISKMFLESIKKYLWKRKDFDAPKFYDDVERVLKPVME